jgi:hypothetical protein
VHHGPGTPCGHGGDLGQEAGQRNPLAIGDQVPPESQPISTGGYSRGMPLVSTKGMPVKQARIEPDVAVAPAD